MRYDLPDKKGYFGRYGGSFVPETLMPCLEELKAAYSKYKNDKVFLKELNRYLTEYAGRPTPVYYCRNLSRKYGFKVYLKREDLCHTGAHKINNCIGQVLLAKKMGKKRIIAETGAGQHGVATATVAALFGMECVVYMGEQDIKRQAPNVLRMELLGAKVVPVRSGTATLKEAVNEALRDWMTDPENTFYCIGSCIGPHPYPMMVRDFQSVIGKEIKAQIGTIHPSTSSGQVESPLQKTSPDILIACVGGGSNSMGMFHPFLDDKKVKLIGVEAGGRGKGACRNSAPLAYGKPGILHGAKSYLLQTKDGQVSDTHSVSAGLDYPGVGPEHSYLKDIGRVRYVSVSDKEALEAFRLLSKEEGIIPALESSHALAYLPKLKGKISKKSVVVVCLSGRGDKDLDIVFEK